VYLAQSAPVNSPKRRTAKTISVLKLAKAAPSR
jgi:hypothetical protein